MQKIIPIKPKISGQMIVFNAESVLPKNMLTLCIENALPYLSEMIIVEGATKAGDDHYFDGCTEFFTTDGRSQDGTIDVLKKIEQKYPDKIKLIIGDGWWNGKTEMCNAAAKIATGDYIFQIDNDEFYHQTDMEKLIGMLEAWQPHQVEFYANHFFGGFDYCIDEREHGWGNDPPWRRIFKNIPGRSKWLRHEPPVYSVDGFPNERGFVINRDKTLQAGIKLFHYAYVQKSQIDFKTKFFNNDQYPILWEQFQKNKSTKIFGSNVYPFTGKHPKIIEENFINIIESNPDADNILETGR